MYKVDDYIVYRKDVCKIVGIKHNDLNNKDYYILVPVSDESLKIDVPIDNEKSNLRSLVSKKEIE